MHWKRIGIVLHVMKVKETVHSLLYDELFPNKEKSWWWWGGGGGGGAGRGGAGAAAGGGAGGGVLVNVCQNLL